jgi:hypothetical protein
MSEINGACLFVNMFCLEKPNSPVFQTGCSHFSDCAEKTEWFDLPNRTVWFWQTEHMLLLI